jgi:hypothetical protein
MIATLGGVSSVGRGHRKPCKSALSSLQESAVQTFCVDLDIGDRLAVQLDRSLGD